jgi:hypothetical protein
VRRGWIKQAMDVHDKVAHLRVIDAALAAAFHAL